MHEKQLMPCHIPHHFAHPPQSPFDQMHSHLYRLSSYPPHSRFHQQHCHPGHRCRIPSEKYLIN